jgi:hypothetical protein
VHWVKYWTGRMEREVVMVRDGVVVWRGLVQGGTKNDITSAQEYFGEAWRRALQDGAVSDADADRVQFRISAP